MKIFKKIMMPAAVVAVSVVFAPEIFAQRITAEEVESKSKDEFIDGLLGRMTVDEKIGQLNLPSYGNVKPDAKKRVCKLPQKPYDTPHAYSPCNVYKTSVIRCMLIN